MKKEVNWLIICHSGRVFGEKVNTLQEVLGAVYRDMQSGGSQYDAPNILMLNGKIIVEKNLSDLAWRYGQFRAEKYDELDKVLYAKAEDLVPEFVEYQSRDLGE